MPNQRGARVTVVLACTISSIHNKSFERKYVIALRHMFDAHLTLKKNHFQYTTKEEEEEATESNTNS